MEGIKTPFDFLKTETLPTREILAKSERAQLIKEVYEIYCSIIQKEIRKKINWKRYCQWCKDQRIPDGIPNRERFRKNKLFIKEAPINSFCFLVSHIKTQDLPYIKSVALDMDRRSQSVGGWLFAKPQK